MRALNHFSPTEWLQLVPLQHALKQARNDVWQAAYTRMRPPGLDDFLARNAHLAGRNVVLVIAFEQPWALDWLLRRAAHCLVDATVLVLDNSRRAEARQAIDRVCRERGVACLALPRNPTRHVNRSHGMAMSWTFHNVVRPLRPRVFGFVDHDLIPLQHISIAERIGTQICYGLVLQRAWAWHLWAGYCFFDHEQVAHRRLNFLYDFSNDLDTGGRNWRALYRHHDVAGLAKAPSEVIPIDDLRSGEPCHLSIVDGAWYHIGGISYNDNFRAKSAFAHRLADAFDAGRSWTDILQHGVA